MSTHPVLKPHAPFGTLVALSLLLTIAPVSWAISKPDPSCLLHAFSKMILQGVETDFDTLSDLGGVLPSFREVLPSVSSAMTANERYALLRDMPIKSIIAAPGHRYLRKPQQVESIAQYILSSAGGDFSHDKILLNLVADSNGSVRSVDLWNAHHRLLAYLETNYRKVGDIPATNMEILVNGNSSAGETWKHYLSIGGVDADAAKPYSLVPRADESIREGTVAVSGELSNYDLGSRNTLGQLHRTMKTRTAPKVGVYFGTFDPIHEGHFKVASDSITELGLDELVIIPNGNPIHKPGATPLRQRLNMVTIRTQNEPKMNVYIGDTQEIINQFGRDPFIERLAQSYGTHEIYQIIGEDSFRKLVEQGTIRPGMNRKFMVFRRQGESGNLSIPPELASMITIAKSRDVQDLSSTAIRSKLKTGPNPDPAQLHQDVLTFINQMGLYR